jgi:hypothetical protein
MRKKQNGFGTPTNLWYSRSLSCPVGGDEEEVDDFGTSTNLWYSRSLSCPVGGDMEEVERFWYFY